MLWSDGQKLHSWSNLQTTNDFTRPRSRSFIRRDTLAAASAIYKGRTTLKIENSSS
jgi:hypothetical protein